MVSSISSINQYPVNNEALEVIRRLQSLGVTPSGNLSIDKQRLQAAELQKRQATLATNSEQNLNKLTGTGKDFSSTLTNINKQLPAVVENRGNNNVQSIGLVKGTQSLHTYNSGNKPVGEADGNDYESVYKMVGATQLGELKKIRLGLIA